MPYRVNLPPFEAPRWAYGAPPIREEAETPETNSSRNWNPETDEVRPRLPDADDPYHERVRNALRSIAALGYPPGTLAWAETAHQELYRGMITAPMVEIEKLWQAGAPMVQFERVLADWVEAHRTAGNLHEQFLATRRQ